MTLAEFTHLTVGGAVPPPLYSHVCTCTYNMVLRKVHDWTLWCWAKTTIMHFTNMALKNWWVCSLHQSRWQVMANTDTTARVAYSITWISWMASVNNAGHAQNQCTLHLAITSNCLSNPRPPSWNLGTHQSLPPSCACVYLIPYKIPNINFAGFHE